MRADGLCNPIAKLPKTHVFRLETTLLITDFSRHFACIHYPGSVPCDAEGIFLGSRLQCLSLRQAGNVDG